MIVEVIVAVVLVLAGASVLHISGVRSVWGTVVASVPLGAGVLALIVVLLAAVGLNPHPVTVLIVTSVVSAAGLWYRRDGRFQRWLILGAVVVTVGALTVVFYALGLVAVTADSYQYMTIGAFMNGPGVATVGASTLQQRGVVVAGLHSLAGLNQDFYLRSLGPLVGLSVLGCLAWFGAHALGERARSRTGTLVLISGCLLVASNNRFVFNIFYINGHLLFAAWLLIGVACLWLVASERAPQRMLAMSLISLTALAVVRPESPLVALLAIAAVLPVASVSDRWKSALLVGTGAVTVAWHGTLLRLFGQGGSAPVEVWAILGVGLVVTSVGFLWKHVGGWLPASVLYILMGVMALALVAFALIETDVLIESLSAMYANIVAGEGLYGASLVVLVVLLAAAVRRRIPAMPILAFPVVAAVPLGLLAAHVRAGEGGAYRVGPGDSLNRMLLHWLPLAALLLISMAASRPKHSLGMNTDDQAVSPPARGQEASTGPGRMSGVATSNSAGATKPALRPPV